jgi:hypothetical protein
MKGRVASLAVLLVIACLLATGVNAKGKPDQPGGSKPELIEFTGDLAGWQIVEGCCPNAGPFPEYTMTLGGDLCDLPTPDCTYDGQLFINSYSGAPGQNMQNRRYIVQFWSESFGAIEIIGGEIYEDRKNKVTRVIFTDEACLDMNSGAFIAFVNFELKRTR